VKHATKILLLGLLTSLLLLNIAAARQTHFENLTARQAAGLISTHRNDKRFVILDVRTPVEFKAGHIKGAVLLDYYDSDFVQKLKRLDRAKTYLLYCRSGSRSSRTLHLIKDMGFTSIYHLQKGILSWRRAALPLVKLENGPGR